MRNSIELVADKQNLCGEAPLWDYRRQCLYWVDQDDGGLFRYVPDKRDTEVQDERIRITGIALNKGGGIVAAGMDGLFLWKEGKFFRNILSKHEDKILSFNDIIADSEGRIYGGTLYWDEKGITRPGNLYRIDKNGTAYIEDDGIILSNGLAFSPDNNFLYFADSGKRSIFLYDYDRISGRLSNRRIFVEVPSEEGIPDGITVDSEGFVWCALWYGGKVVRFNPDGVKEREIKFPVMQVSSVMFGGRNLSDLYVTTAGKYWSSILKPSRFDSKQPMGGGLYRVKTEIAGIREHFADFDAFMNTIA